MIKAILLTAVVLLTYSYVLSQESEETEELPKEWTRPSPRYIFKPTSTVNLTQWTPTVVTLGELLFGRNPYIIG